jgi:hypothetical protein
MDVVPPGKDLAAIGLLQEPVRRAAGRRLLAAGPGPGIEQMVTWRPPVDGGTGGARRWQPTTWPS